MERRQVKLDEMRKKLSATRAKAEESPINLERIIQQIDAKEDKKGATKEAFLTKEATKEAALTKYAKEATEEATLTKRRPRRRPL